TPLAHGQAHPTPLAEWRQRSTAPLQWRAMDRLGSRAPYANHYPGPSGKERRQSWPCSAGSADSTLPALPHHTTSAGKESVAHDTLHKVPSLVCLSHERWLSLVAIGYVLTQRSLLIS